MNTKPEIYLRSVRLSAVLAFWSVYTYGTILIHVDDKLDDGHRVGSLDAGSHFISTIEAIYNENIIHMTTVVKKVAM